MVAVKDNRLSIVERLLDMGADINAKTKVGTDRYGFRLRFIDTSLFDF